MVPHRGAVRKAFRRECHDLPAGVRRVKLTGAFP